MIKRTLLFALGLVLAACTPKDVEVGPYTVSVIGKNVYHIQDYNHENPAGEAFDADGKLTHFNNCSDIYLVVGANEALLIDLSNPVNWAENAAESLRSLVAERVKGKPLTITFTHNHGDHTGMLPAYLEDKEVRFALPQADFRQLAERFPEGRFRFIGEGEPAQGAGPALHRRRHRLRPRCLDFQRGRLLQLCLRGSAPDGSAGRTRGG